MAVMTSLLITEPAGLSVDRTRKEDSFWPAIKVIRLAA